MCQMTVPKVLTCPPSLHEAYTKISDTNDYAEILSILTTGLSRTISLLPMVCFEIGISLGGGAQVYIEGMNTVYIENPVIA